MNLYTCLPKPLPSHLHRFSSLPFSHLVAFLTEAAPSDHKFSPSSLR